MVVSAGDSYWFLVWFFFRNPHLSLSSLLPGHTNIPSVLVLIQRSSFPHIFSTDLFGTIFFQEANDSDLYSYNADTASGLHSLEDLYCEHTFLLPDAQKSYEVRNHLI